ncbi:MAG: pyridoxal-phosphate dependent enzyme, partial [Chloroflexota bacterium]
MSSIPGLQSGADHDRAQVFQGLSRSVGNTPLFSIRCRFRGVNRTIFAKPEHFNLTGSVKDRMALHILRQAHLGGHLYPGDRIVEATSGN